MKAQTVHFVVFFGNSLLMILIIQQQLGSTIALAKISTTAPVLSLKDSAYTILRKTNAIRVVIYTKSDLDNFLLKYKFNGLAQGHDISVIRPNTILDYKTRRNSTNTIKIHLRKNNS